MLFLGAWGKMIHEKKEKKSCDTLPLNICGRRRAPVISAASLQRAKERKKLLESKLWSRLSAGCDSSPSNHQYQYCHSSCPDVFAA